MQGDFQPLAPLGMYYGESWFVPRRVEGLFSPLINRTPEQATRARQEPLPPNLETYAAALTRDQIDETLVMEWSPFMVDNTDRGGWNAKCRPRNIYAVSTYVPRTRKEDEVASAVATSVGEEK
jgi:hypothetical protein